MQAAQTPASKLRVVTPDNESSMNTLWQGEEYGQICSRESLTEKAAEIEKTISVKEHERERYDFVLTVSYENRFWNQRPDSLHQVIPLNTTILALGHKDLGIRVHLLIPDWESGHSDLLPRLMADHIVKKLLESKSLPLAWPHDGGEALGSLGTKILGGHKLAPGTTSPFTG